MSLPNSEMSLHIADESAMVRLGAVLAQLLPLSPRIALHGDLGAGKSTLARACLRELGVRGSIKSPTYTLIERYLLDDGSEAWHLDLYRIADPEELEFLGLDDAGVRFWLIEWAERGTGVLPAADIDIEIAQVSPESRNVKIVARTSQYVMQIAKLLKDFH